MLPNEIDKSKKLFSHLVGRDPSLAEVQAIEESSKNFPEFRLKIICEHNWVNDTEKIVNGWMESLTPPKCASDNAELMHAIVVLELRLSTISEQVEKLQRSLLEKFSALDKLTEDFHSTKQILDSTSELLKQYRQRVETSHDNLTYEAAHA